MTKKMPKRPKQPKSNASVAAMEHYIEKVKAWKKEVEARKRERLRKEALKKKVAQIGKSLIR